MNQQTRASVGQTNATFDEQIWLAEQKQWRLHLNMSGLVSDWITLERRKILLTYCCQERRGMLRVSFENKNLVKNRRENNDQTSELPRHRGERFGSSDGLLSGHARHSGG